MLSIDIDTTRRFILGKQGLRPDRRWRGIEGTEQAMRTSSLKRSAAQSCPDRPDCFARKIGALLTLSHAARLRRLNARPFDVTIWSAP
jgi:hypothetical protein